MCIFRLQCYHLIKLPIYRLVIISSIQWSFTLGHTFINNTYIYSLPRPYTKCFYGMKVKVAQSVRLFATPWTTQFMEFSRPEYSNGSLSLLSGIFPTQGLNPGLPHCRQTLPTEPQGKPKKTGVGSLSLLQQFFLTQKSNWGLPHCRQILYQLSYQVNPSMQWGI